MYKKEFAAGFILFLLLSVPSGAAPPEPAGSGERTFAVILYGGPSRSDLETVAFIEIEGDGVEIGPRGSSDRYTVIRGLREVDAYRIAVDFVRRHVNSRDVEERVVHLEGDGAMGLEIRPTYDPLVYGTADLIDVSYAWKEPGKLSVAIGLKPYLEDWIFQNH